MGGGTKKGHREFIPSVIPTKKEKCLKAGEQNTERSWQTKKGHEFHPVEGDPVCAFLTLEDTILLSQNLMIGSPGEDDR